VPASAAQIVANTPRAPTSSSPSATSASKACSAPEGTVYNYLPINIMTG
jgi:hypothetical protein